MTAHPIHQVAGRDGLRLVKGRRGRKPTVAPWMIMAIIGVIAFLGLGFARTSLDRSAFELTELNKAMAEQTALNQQLRIEIAQLENPARIGPLAEELGLVIPQSTNQLLVDLAPTSPVVAGTDTEDKSQ